ncbi:MAG: hypothetical protein HGB37_02190 [Candidatus Moranbacteria bacterium]|nr:hypothetical protein [Candidatus Moranbacteria bacterium]
MREYKSLNFVYIQLIVLVSVGISFVVFYFTKFSLYIELPFGLVVATILVVVFWESRDKILETILSEGLKDRYGTLIIKWKSRGIDSFLGDDVIQLLHDSEKLIDTYESALLNDRIGMNTYSDYSFLLLPAAKALEGTMKKALIKMGYIKDIELKENPSINVGGIFNPVGNTNISNNLKDKNRDKSVPHEIYATYQQCRNHILHYDLFSDSKVRTVAASRVMLSRIEMCIENMYYKFNLKKK